MRYNLILTTLFCSILLFSCADPLCPHTTECTGTARNPLNFDSEILENTDELSSDDTAESIDDLQIPQLVYRLEFSSNNSNWSAHIQFDSSETITPYTLCLRDDNKQFSYTSNDFEYAPSDNPNYKRMLIVHDIYDCAALIYPCTHGSYSNTNNDTVTVISLINGEILHNSYDNILTCDIDCEIEQLLYNQNSNQQTGNRIVCDVISTVYGFKISLSITDASGNIIADKFHEYTVKLREDTPEPIAFGEVDTTTFKFAPEFSVADNVIDWNKDIVAIDPNNGYDLFLAFGGYDYPEHFIMYNIQDNLKLSAVTYTGDECRVDNINYKGIAYHLPEPLYLGKQNLHVYISEDIMIVGNRAATDIKTFDLPARWYLITPIGLTMIENDIYSDWYELSFFETDGIGIEYSVISAAFVNAHDVYSLYEGFTSDNQFYKESGTVNFANNKIVFSRTKYQTINDYYNSDECSYRHIYKSDAKNISEFFINLK